jgi:hypothetical protein
MNSILNVGSGQEPELLEGVGSGIVPAMGYSRQQPCVPRPNERTDSRINCGSEGFLWAFRFSINATTRRVAIPITLSWERDNRIQPLWFVAVVPLQVCVMAWLSSATSRFSRFNAYAMSGLQIAAQKAMETQRSTQRSVRSSALAKAMFGTFTIAGGVSG